MKSFHHFHFWNQEKLGWGVGITYMCTKNSVAISFFLAVSDELKVSDLQEKKKTNMANQAFPKEYLNVN